MSWFTEQKSDGNGQGTTGGFKGFTCSSSTPAEKFSFTAPAIATAPTLEIPDQQEAITAAEGFEPFEKTYQGSDFLRMSGVAHKSCDDPCPPWIGVRKTKIVDGKKMKRYPIPMMGDHRQHALYQELMGDPGDYVELPWPRSKPALSPTNKKSSPAEHYLYFEREEAIAKLQSMSNSEAFTSLLFKWLGRSYFSTMVHLAAYRRDLELLHMLFERFGPAVLLVQDGMGASPLMTAMTNDGPVPEFLFEHMPADVYILPNFEGGFLLHFAIQRPTDDAVRLLVKHHPHTDWRYLNRVPSRQVHTNSEPIVIRAALSGVASLPFLWSVLPQEVLNMRSSDGEHVVHVLAGRPKVEDMEKLVDAAGRQVLKELSMSGKTVLHAAVEGGSIVMVEYLLLHMEEEDITRPCKARGQLALHLAVRKKQVEIARLLAAAMPSSARHVPDLTGYSAWQLAEELDAHNVSLRGHAGTSMTEALAKNAMVKGAM